jgi:hypothetical protein
MLASPKQQLALIAFSTFLAAFSLASIINFTDPAADAPVTLSFFYASLFIFCLGAFTLVGLGLRQKFYPGHYVLNLRNSFRQGFFIGILIAASFALLSQRLLFWWVELSLILFLAAVEAFLNLKV